MAEKPGKDSFQDKKVAQTFNTLTCLLLVLVLGAGGLNYMIAAKEKMLLQQIATAEEQSMLAQRMALLISQYQQTNDDKLLAPLKSAASTAFINHDQLEPVMLSVMPSDVLADGSTREAHMTTMREFIKKAMAYAASPYSTGAKSNGQAVIQRAAHDIPDMWGAMITDFAIAAQKKIDMLVKISYGLLALTAGFLVYGAATLVNPALAHIARQRSDLERLAALDNLSGAYNRAMLFKVANMLISTSRRHKQTLTALAVDIDELKKVNDVYGRAAGDALIRKVAATINDVLRTSDVMGRVGGAEFGIFLPSVDEPRALLVAEKVRAAIQAMPFTVKESMILVYVSIGVAEMQAHHKTPDDMLRAAEVALHAAKSAGRNRVAAFSITEADAVKGVV
jgi:diguanylate cyclase (GGDEF)-like protein